MYNKFQLARKYVHYLFNAENGKGHGVHSPFVFDFITHVLRDRKTYECYATIENQRKKLRHNPDAIEITDLGAGSSVMKTNKRKIQDIAATSLKPGKYAQLLFRIARYYQSKNIVELGTSLGITTAYLASAHPEAQVYTCEGAPAIAAIAQRNFDELGLKNVHLIQGNFNHTLPTLIPKFSGIDLAFIDGNHQEEPTLLYFEQLLQRANAGSIFILDDIHWSHGMEAAWHTIQEHKAVTLSIDLFFIGLVFFSPDFKVKQHFSIRF